MGEYESFDPTETRAIDEPLAGWEYDHNRFASSLERRGFRIAREVPEQQRVYINVEPGEYSLATGFESPDANLTHFFYGNNLPDKQHIPVRVDVNGPRFSAFRESFIQSIAGSEIADLEALIRLFDGAMSKQWGATTEDEDIRSLENLFTQKATVCEGKAEIAGLTLPRLNIPGIRTAKIRGTSHKIDKRRPHDIGHAWLRVEYEGDAVLYDPYFHRVAHVNDFATSPFASYEVEAGFIFNMRARSSGVRLVDAFDALTKELYLSPQNAFEAQVNGRAQFDLSFPQLQEVMFEQGALVRRRTPNDYKSARLMNPLIDLKKV